MKSEAGQLVIFRRWARFSCPGRSCFTATCARIIKLGAQGAVCATKEETFFVPAFPVSAVDTVAAGDAFTGSSSLWRKGFPYGRAVVRAAGALASTKPGAQSSMCDRDVRCVSPTALIEASIVGWFEYYFVTFAQLHLPQQLVKLIRFNYIFAKIFQFFPDLYPNIFTSDI